MKILMINKFLYPKGGSEMYMFGLADYLTQHGHQIRYFGMDDPQNIVEKDNNLLVRHIDFHQKSLQTLLYPFSIIYSTEARKNLRRYIEEFKPDIAHLNNYNFQITPSIIYELKKYKIPIVQTVHDPVIVCPAHSLFNFQTGEICEKCKGRKYLNCIKTKCIHGSSVRSVLGAFEGFLYYKLKTYDNIHTLICPSKFIADKIVEFGVKQEQVRVVHNFVKEQFANEGFAKENYVLYFGRLTEEKGIRTLLKAAEQLGDIKFVVAGKGPLEDELKNLKNIQYVGFKYGEELRELIQKSLFTVCPSELYENCPMSILESFGLGTPAIGANIGGIPELISDTIDGLLFEPGNVEDFKNKIRYLFDSPEKIREFAEAGKRKVNKFLINSYYDQLMDIYNKAIQDGGR